MRFFPVDRRVVVCPGAGILLEGRKFEDVSSFQHDGVTCLLFPFEGAKLDGSRLAMWRIQTHAAVIAILDAQLGPKSLGNRIILDIQTTAIV